MSKKIIFCAFLIVTQSFLCKSQSKITFTVHAPAAQNSASENLFIAGDFNGWKAADTSWKLQLVNGGNHILHTTLKPGLYGYKITRGSWQSVEVDAAGKGIANRQIKVSMDTNVNVTVRAWQDNFAAVEKKHTASKRVRVMDTHFKMPQLGRERRVWIYLPADYDKSKRRYPVIYMHDGQNLFDEFTAGYGEWGIDELMDKLPANKQCIIIGIDHGGDNRITEYDPFDSKYGKGRGADYIDFLVKTLKPYIDTHYRTKPDARHTAIAGSSMGGLISMYAGLKCPEVFGQSGIFSPAFWIAPPIYEYAAKQHVAGARFYFVCGDAESESMVPDMQKMAKIVQGQPENDPNTPVIVVKGAQHNEQQWHDDFPAFYQWLTKGFK